MKKIISALLIWSLCLSFLLSVPAQAGAETFEVFTYEVVDGEAAITDVDVSAGAQVVIPAAFEEYPVTAIGSNAFSAIAVLKSVTIPVSVTTVGDGAFEACSDLETVYYYGDEAQWQSISVGSRNEALTGANIVYNYQPIHFAEVEFWRLILKEDIGVAFELSFTEEIMADENAYVEVDVAGEITQVPLPEAINGLQVNVAAAQLTDAIKITVVSETGDRDEVGTYSVKAYADRIIAGDYDIATKKIVKALLHYGAMAQNFFQYRVEEPANENIEFAATPVPQTEEIPVYVTGRVPGIAFYGASVCYENQLALRYYFLAESISNYTFTANGVVLEAKEKDNLYYVEVPGILPQEMGDYFLIQVQNSQGGTLAVAYNPINYVVRMYHNADAPENSKNLLQALYSYYLSAKAYIA